MGLKNSSCNVLINRPGDILLNLFDSLIPFFFGAHNGLFEQFNNWL